MIVDEQPSQIKPKDQLNMTNNQRSHTSIFNDYNMGGKAQDLHFAF